MDKELFRNGSGYVDPTAYKALQNYQRSEGTMIINRGEIWEVIVGNSNEYKAALVLSAGYRANDKRVSIILLEDIERRDSVPVVCQGMKYVDCTYVSFCYADKFETFIKCATENEMKAIDAGVAKALGLEMQDLGMPTESIAEVIAPMVAEDQDDANLVKIAAEELGRCTVELEKVKAQASIYKDLYEQILAKVMDRGC